MNHRLKLLCLGLGLALMLLSACSHNAVLPAAELPQDDSHPGVASIYYFLSASLLNYEGDYLSAAELYRRALEQDPGSREIRKQYLIASVNNYLYRKGELEPVLELFAASRDFIATDPDLLNSAYSLYSQAEKAEEMEWTLSTLVKRYPSSKAYLQLFLAEYQFKKNLKESYLQKAYQLANGNPEELLTLAKIYTLADPKRSIAILKEVRAKNGSAEATYLLGDYALRYGYHKDAAELFASFSYPADRTPMLAFLQQANKHRAYRQILAFEAQTLATQDAELIAELALAAYLESDYNALKRISLALEKKYPEPVADAKIAVFLVAAALDSPLLDQPAKYLDYLHGARDADDILLYRTLHLTLAAVPDSSISLQAWREDLENHLPPSLWKDYLLAATIATSADDPLLNSTRVALCEALCDGTRGYDSDYSYLLSHYHLNRQFERKIPLLHNALRRFPDNPLFLNDLGYSLLDFPDSLQTAGKLIQRAVNLEPDNAFYQDSLAWYYYLSGDYPKALEHIQIPLALESLPSEIAYHIGMILIANTNPDLASTYLKMAAADDKEPLYQKLASQALEKLQLKR